MCISQTVLSCPKGVVTYQKLPLATFPLLNVNHEDTADETGAAPHYGDSLNMNMWL